MILRSFSVLTKSRQLIFDQILSDLFSYCLVEVVVGAAGDRVEEHEVLKVGDLAPLPLLRHVRRPACTHRRGG